jgi:hypothetical protein
MAFFSHNLLYFSRELIMALGNFTIKLGTSGDNSITASPLQVVLGLAGNDRLTAGGSSVGITSILAGGKGNDTYVVPLGQGAIILDSEGGDDSVLLPFSRQSLTAFAYTIDNRHLVLGDSANGSFATILDWRTPANKIEKFTDSTGFTLSYDQIVSQYLPVSRGNFSLQQTDGNLFAYISPSTGLKLSDVNGFISDVAALEKGNATLDEVKADPTKAMVAIRDYDGNDLGASGSWRLVGDVDIQGDGDQESIFVNPTIGRFASVGSVNGLVDFSKHGSKGDTRVVGIYIDPTLLNQPQNVGGPFDSQRRFQNDLRTNNLSMLAAADYNKDGFQDVYFKISDGSSVLRALMHADGNIQYANYQSKADLAAFMTANNVSSAIWGSWI